MKTYQQEILAALERAADRYDVPVTVSYKYANEGVLIAGTPFVQHARAVFDFQDSNTTIRFNDASSGNRDLSFFWYIDDSDTANKMLAKWQQLIREALDGQ